MMLHRWVDSNRRAIFSCPDTHSSSHFHLWTTCAARSHSRPANPGYARGYCNIGAESPPLPFSAHIVQIPLTLICLSDRTRRLFVSLQHIVACEETSSKRKSSIHVVSPAGLCYRLSVFASILVLYLSFPFTLWISCCCMQFFIHFY